MSQEYPKRSWECEPENPNLNALKCRWCGTCWWFEVPRPFCQLHAKDELTRLFGKLAAVERENAEMKAGYDATAVGNFMRYKAEVERERDLARSTARELAHALSEAIRFLVLANTAIPDFLVTLRETLKRAGELEASK